MIEQRKSLPYDGFKMATWITGYGVLVMAVFVGFGLKGE